MKTYGITLLDDQGKIDLGLTLLILKLVGSAHVLRSFGSLRTYNTTLVD